MKIYQVFEAQEEWVDHYYGDTILHDCNLEVHNNLIKSFVSKERAEEHKKFLELKYKEESDKSDHCSYCPVWYMTKRKLSYKKNMEELVSYCESKINFHPDLEYVGNRVNCKNYCVMPYDRKYFIKEIEVEE